MVVGPFQQSHVARCTSVLGSGEIPNEGRMFGCCGLHQATSKGDSKYTFKGGGVYRRSGCEE